MKKRGARVPLGWRLPHCSSHGCMRSTTCPAPPPTVPPWTGMQLHQCRCPGPRHRPAARCTAGPDSCTGPCCCHSHRPTRAVAGAAQASIASVSRAFRCRGVHFFDASVEDPVCRLVACRFSNRLHSGAWASSLEDSTLTPTRRRRFGMRREGAEGDRGRGVGEGAPGGRRPPRWLGRCWCRRTPWACSLRSRTSSAARPPRCARSPRSGRHWQRGRISMLHLLSAVTAGLAAVELRCLCSLLGPRLIGFRKLTCLKAWSTT